MAIDPTIALNFKPTTPADFSNSMKTGLDMAATNQNILASRQSTANAAAIQPGLEADSATKQRDLAGKQWMGIHQNEFMQDNPAGGPPIVNHTKMMAAAQAAGFADLVPTIAKDFTTSAQNSISQVKDQANLDLTKFQISRTLTPAIAQYSDGIQVKDAKGNIDKNATLLAQMQSVNNMRDHQLQTFGPDVVNDKTYPTFTNVNDFEKWKTGQKNFALSPQEQAGLALQTQQTANQTVQTGVAVKAQNLGIDQIGVSVTDLNNKTQTLLDAANAYDSIKGSIPTKGGQFLAAAWENLVATNPAAGKVQAGIDAYNASHGTNYNVATTGMQDLIRRDASQINNQAQTNTRIIQNAGRPAAQVAPVSANKPAPIVSTGNNVQMVDSNGRTIFVDKSHINDAKSRGFAQVQ